MGRKSWCLLWSPFSHILCYIHGQVPLAVSLRKIQNLLIISTTNYHYPHALRFISITSNCSSYFYPCLPVFSPQQPCDGCKCKSDHVPHSVESPKSLQWSIGHFFLFLPWRCISNFPPLLLPGIQPLLGSLNALRCSHDPLCVHCCPSRWLPGSLSLHTGLCSNDWSIRLP